MYVFVIQSKSLWLNLEILEAFVMGLKVSVLGDFQLGGSNFWSLGLEFWNLAVSQSLKFTILFPFCFILLMSFTGCYTEDEPKRQPFYVVGIMYMFWEVFTSYFEILKFSA